MKHARQDYNRIQDPEGLIPENEPVFLIRAQDVVGALAVEAWAGLAEENGATPEIVQAALGQAKAMREYRVTHGGKTPDLSPNA